MLNVRAYLRSALVSVAGGGDLTSAQLDAAVPDPRSLDRAERDAWEVLSHWADDEDIRKNDAEYALYLRERMLDRIAALDGYWPKEIDRITPAYARLISASPFVRFPPSSRTFAPGHRAPPTGRAA